MSYICVRKHTPSTAQRILPVAALLLVIAVVAIVEMRPQPGRIGSAQIEAVITSVADDVPEGVNWKAIVDIDTPWGRHVRFRPEVRGLEIRGADLRLNFSAEHETGAAPARKPGRILGFRNQNMGKNSNGRTPLNLETDGPISWTLEHRLDSEDVQSIERIAEGVGSGASLILARRLSPELRSEPEWHSYVVPGRSGWELWAEAVVHTRSAASLASLPWSDGEEPLIREMPMSVRLDPESGLILEARDARHFDSEYEGSGRAHLFDPSPVVASGDPDLRDGAAVDQYRTWVEIPRLAGNGKPRGRWVTVISDRAPNIVQPDHVFDYLALDPRFEEIMAYYHGDRALNRAEELGYGGLFETPLRMRVHGTEMDNSWYARPTKEVVFGDGGVDDAEDADIIIHETGHALHDQLVPGYGDGDTRSFSEGFCDFWAATLTDDPCIGNWDATSYSPPCLRSTDNDALFPHSVTGEQHTDGQLWSGLLWDIRAGIGRERGEQLALAAFLQQGTRTRWPEAIDGLIHAAELLGFDDEEHRVVEEVLIERGFFVRELAFDLASDETADVDLVGTGQLFDQEFASLLVDGTGRIRFLPLSPDPGAPPAGPSFVACGVTGSSGPAPLGLTTRFAFRITSGTLDAEQQWTTPDGTLVRTAIAWEMGSNSVAWTYLGVELGTEPLAFYSEVLASETPAEIEPIDYRTIPSEGLGDLYAFRDEFGSNLADLVGARFELRPDPLGSGYLVYPTAPAQSLDEVAILLKAQPNPFLTGTEVRLFLERSAPAEVGVFDARGRRVRDLMTRRILPAGLTPLVWDGTDDRGNLLPSGRYWVRAFALGRANSLGLIRLR